MEKLKMHSINKVDDNIEKIGRIFPNCITERINENGEIEHAIDFDVLKQELSPVIVEGNEERYQFTWPDKKKSILLANSPISKTLRPCREESVDFDNTENLYIEGDNLDVLKILQETYLGKIKVIYIDPPYNTGKDLLYKDNYAISTHEYLMNSYQYDDDGNIMFQNIESDGRFHSKWLNDIYPRIKLSKDLLTDDGIIFISIDEKEYHNLRKICDEVFGEKNYIGDLTWEATTQPINTGSAKFGLQKKTEAILMYAKKKNSITGFELEEVEGTLSYPHIGKYGPCRFEIIEKSDVGGDNRETMKFSILGQYPREGKRWQIGEQTARTLEKEGKLEIVNGIVKKAIYPEDELDKKKYKPFWSFLSAESVGTAQTGKDELNKIIGKPIGFDTVKPTKLIRKLLSYLGKDYYVLDFYSGSATTGHAAMIQNIIDGGSRKFILVQYPEKCNENSEAFKYGYKTICELGKDRLRKAIKKLKKDDIVCDLGFRTLKCDTTNMKDVYYRPSEYKKSLFDFLTDNIKEDRTPEDLLFQVMLDLGILLSSKIEVDIIEGKKVFNVAEGFLIACFDENVTEGTIKAIAKQKPYYFVMRDSSMENDNVATNFDQIFATYSPDTVRKVL